MLISKNTLVNLAFVFECIMFFTMMENRLVAQGSAEEESLSAMLQTSGYDSTRIKIQMRLFELYNTSDTGKANACLANLTKELDSANISVSHALLFQIGNIYQQYRTDFSKTLKFYQLATEQAQQENDYDYLSYKSWWGYILSRTGDQEHGLLHLLDVVETVEKNELTNRMPLSYLLLAYVYRMTEQLDKAEVYFNKSISASTLNADSSYVHTALHEIGNLYLIREEYEDALAYHQKALAIRLSMPEKPDLLYSYNDIAQDYLYMGRPGLALDYYLMAEKLAKESGDKLSQFYICFGIINIYLSNNELSKIPPYLATMEQFANELRVTPVYESFYSTMSKYYRKQNQFEKALTYLELSEAYEDSITNEEVKKHISDLDKKFETTKKDQELLTKQERIKRQQMLIVFTACIIALLTVLVIVVLRNFNLKKTAFRKLELQNLEILKQREEIISAKNEAERSNRAKSEFLSRMSHELRTPLNAILGFAQLMESGELNPKLSKGVNRILNNGRHLLSLINDILDISGIEAGKQPITLEPVKAAEIIEEVTDSLQVVAANKNVTVTFVDTPANSLFVMADKRRFKQVIINLLSNAIKYNNDGGSVTIEIAKQAGDEQSQAIARVLVRDTGPGIAKESIGKLFQAFERIDAHKSGIEGTGLGLVMVRKLIDEMGGKTGVESEVGKGSTFWVELPVSDNFIASSSQNHHVLSHGKYDNDAEKTVLYIEDNTGNIELVEGILAEQRPEIRLITSNYGNQTLELAKAHQPALILLDIDLPDISGADVMVKLLADERTKSIPVVVLTADAMAFQEDKLLNAGAKYYLTKPFEITHFLQIIDRNGNC